MGPTSKVDSPVAGLQRDKMDRKKKKNGEVRSIDAAKQVLLRRGKFNAAFPRVPIAQGITVSNQPERRAIGLWNKESKGFEMFCARAFEMDKGISC